mmetsp:Transcript_15319/g.19407  ORF Transcript_15319/g.19407 Transcript_15319/m.19407 type:complete len:81 (+) Transcript_15319:332-574(+)
MPNNKTTAGSFTIGYITVQKKITPGGNTIPPLLLSFSLLLLFDIGLETIVLFWVLFLLLTKFEIMKDEEDDIGDEFERWC